MFFTIIGGIIFVGSQAWEWANFISGEYGAVETKAGRILQFVNAEGEQVALESFAADLPTERVMLTKSDALWYESDATLPDFNLEEIVEGFKANPDLLIRTELLNESNEKTILSRAESLERLERDAIGVVQGANLIHNEYGPPLFADFFFFITGFHGFHVLSGVIINIIIFINVILGTYERRGNYEMVEKVGLYWHFVDLVWVFVFTFFYLV
jgi:cytochrome c oxidase subunit 3